jgi:hypothetical protein
MAFRLNDLVICGELVNTRKNSVNGWLGLRGFDRPLKLELTGNCDPDLAGRHIRFEVHGLSDMKEEDALSGSEEEKLEQSKLKGLAWFQIGVTGTMTASHRVRIADCSTEELCMRLRLDEPPPMRWVRCLYIEWYSQNGRVVLEMPDPVIESVGPDGGVTPDCEDPVEEEPPSQAEGGLNITAFRLNEDGDVEITDETPLPEDDEDSCEECGDSYNLIPDDLQRHLDAQAREVDRSLGNDEEQDEFIREMEAMDDAIEKGDRVSLGSLFDEAVKLPKPDRLTEQQAEVELKGLLTRLAMFGIALHMCEHFTALDAYRLLVERLCKEEVAFAELCKTSWIQHFDTAEYCDQCEADMDRKYRESEGCEEDDAPPDDAGDSMPDDDMPHKG